MNRKRLIFGTSQFDIEIAIEIKIIEYLLEWISIVSELRTQTSSHN